MLRRTHWLCLERLSYFVCCVPGRRERFKCQSVSFYGAFQFGAPGDWTGFCFSWIDKDKTKKNTRWLNGFLLSNESTCSNTSSGPVGQIPGWRGQRGGLAGTIWQVINKKLISYEKQHYQRLGDEGFLLAPYSPLLRLAKKHSKTVKLKGGFVPKRFTFRITIF